MPDYYSILTRAISDLAAESAEARHAVYHRARWEVLALRDRSELPWTELETQRLALESAIERIEAEATSRPAGPIHPRRGHADASELRSPELHPDEAPAKRRFGGIGIAAGALAAMVVAVIVAGTVIGYQQRRAARLEEPSEPRAAAAPEKTGAEIPLSAAAPADNGLPYILRRQVVYYRTSYPSGTIIIAKPQRFLYVIQPNMAAQRFGIAIGQDCGNTVGLFRISQKEMIQQRAGNSPGSRTLYLDSADYIRGTDTPKSIGGSTAVGCFQLINDEMAFLYDRASLDTKVVIMN